MIQYEDQGPEARESRRPFIGASDGHWVLLLLHRVRCSHSTFEIHDGHSTIRVHRCGDHTAMLSGGLTPPSVMPIEWPHESVVEMGRTLRCQIHGRDLEVTSRIYTTICHADR